MNHFTPEQTEILKAMVHTALSYTGSVHAVVSEHSLVLGTLKSLLVSKQIVTEEEFEAALTEARAAVMVETALDPEIQAFREKLNRLMIGGNLEEGG